MGGKSGGGGRASMPDPYEAARLQLGFNQQAGMDSARMNQINQWTPWGGTYWTGEIGSPNRAQHTTYNPTLGRILFGNTYHPHFGGGMPPGGGGGGGGGSTAPPMGLAGILADREAAAASPVEEEMSRDRGGGRDALPGRGVSYDSFSDFGQVIGDIFSGVPGAMAKGYQPARVGQNISWNAPQRPSANMNRGGNQTGGGPDRGSRSVGGGPGGRRGSGDRGR